MKHKIKLVYNRTGAINIKKSVKDHYTALELMCDGLLRQDRRKNFNVDMDTFGKFNGVAVCYGCAATSTIQQLANKWFKGIEIFEHNTRAEYLGFQALELYSFELAIDAARVGDMSELLRFFDEIIDHTILEWHLTNTDWKEDLPEIRKYISDGRARIEL